MVERLGEGREPLPQLALERMGPTLSMIDSLEQYERAEEAIAGMKRFLLVARRTHTPEAYAALSGPILRELQERERDVLAYLSQVLGLAS